MLSHGSSPVSVYLVALLLTIGQRGFADRSSGHPCTSSIICSEIMSNYKTSGNYDNLRRRENQRSISRSSKLLGTAGFDQFSSGINGGSSEAAHVSEDLTETNSKVTSEDSSRYKANLKRDSYKITKRSLSRNHAGRSIYGHEDLLRNHNQITRNQHSIRRRHINGHLEEYLDEFSVPQRLYAESVANEGSSKYHELLNALAYLSKMKKLNRQDIKQSTRTLDESVEYIPEGQPGSSRLEKKGNWENIDMHVWG